MKDGKPVNWVHEYQKMRDARDRWRRVADACVMAIGIPENETDRLAVRLYNQAANDGE